MRRLRQLLSDRLKCRPQAALPRHLRRAATHLWRLVVPAAGVPVLVLQVVAPENLQLPKFKHLLIAFGGPLGLEDALSHDKKLNDKDTSQVFDLYLNTCAGQGSRTIRTEEAMLISMAFLQSAVARFGQQ
jgi:hypothetical protein